MSTPPVSAECDGTSVGLPATSSERGDGARKEQFIRDWEPLTLQASSADYYYNSYNHYGVHEDLLKDTATMSAYQRAIKQNPHLFRGAVVLDVAAGLGTCSMLALRAGAKKVIALEKEPELVSLASKVAVRNGFGPEVLRFVQDDACSLEALPDGIEQVDIIVSEWMGYFLLYEARLHDVLVARDRWLRPGGIILPDRAQLHVAAMEDQSYKEEHFDFFNDVWGFDYSVMRAPAFREPVVNHFASEQLLSSSTRVLDIDLYRHAAEDCFKMCNRFQVVSRRAGELSAALFWFEISFNACHKPISFTTAPWAAPTCWKQTAFFFPGNAKVQKGDRLRGILALRKPAKDKRSLEVKLSFGINGDVPMVQLYRWA
eukprot:TRINITY_DN22545_c0_g1_i1.p1 TRINITY_DN22545_c0_g1~~TRINITY_DN22545_c0_g1_i1.p1  ORF type:complete len:381 (+),score=84.72 TRINITY_DN22545_c0_g1_i1:28-1143(+)